MSNKEFEKIDETIDTTNICECNEETCNCNEEICECGEEACDCTENNSLSEGECFYCDREDCNCEEGEFTGTYTVNFDGLCEELDECEYGNCEIDTKKLALIGAGALLAGGALCYVFKKKKKNKKK